MNILKYSHDEATIHNTHFFYVYSHFTTIFYCEDVFALASPELKYKSIKNEIYYLRYKKTLLRLSV